MFLQLFLIFILIAILYNCYWKRKDFPPGPTPWPMLGNLISMGKYEPGEVFRKWRKEYGSVYTYWLGELPIVAVTDYETTVETLVKDGDAYAGKTDFVQFNQLIRGGTYGVVMTDGELWRDQRRFALHVLRNFGLGKNLMQEKVLDEVSAMLKRIRDDVRDRIAEHNLQSQLDISVGSIINALLFGYRFEGERLAEFLELKTLLQNQMRDFAQPLVMCMLKGTHIFKYVPLFRSMYYKLESNKEKLYGFFQRQVDEHRLNLDLGSGDEPMDYVEAFLREQHKRDGEGATHSFTNIQLLNMCNDLWMAGQETTSSTIGWCMIYMIAHPEVQYRAQKELDRVVGAGRLITIADRPKLHYVNALVHETQRLSNLVPHNAIHRTTRDVVIKGYRIPKNTSVVPQISAVLYDEKVFKTPTKFDPERFLDGRGEFKKIDEMIPFALGKRACLGEGLARMELFLFIANILNQFKISAVEGKYPNGKRIRGGMVQPEPFVCSIERRY